MHTFFSFSSLRACVLLASGGLAACGMPEHTDRGGPVDQVVLSLSAVPADVACLRITATGASRTAVRYFAAPGEPFTQTLGGLPLGAIELVAEAFDKTCDDVRAQAIATWATDPTTVSIAAGRLTSVELTLHRNGRAKVGLGFAEEPACSAAGAVCKADRECCSRACTSGTCDPVLDGGAQDAS